MRRKLLEVSRMTDGAQRAGTPFYLNPNTVQSIMPCGCYCVVRTGKEEFYVAETAESLVRRINENARS